MDSTETKIKHLEFIQGVINRMANNSFLIKGWALTISLAGFGLFANNKKQPLFLAFVLFECLIFWLLDSYYLKQERLFRHLFKDVAISNKKVDFNMDITPYQERTQCVLCTMFSFPLLLIYLAIIVLTAILYYGYK